MSRDAADIDPLRHEIRGFLANFHSCGGLAHSDWDHVRLHATFPAARSNILDGRMEVELQAVVKLACEGNAAAHRTATKLGKYLLLSGETIPPILRSYLVFCLDHPERETRPRGRHWADQSVRNRAIATAVFLALRENVQLTRNPQSERVSACSLVAKELESLGVHMTEANIARIWKGESPDILADR